MTQSRNTWRDTKKADCRYGRTCRLNKKMKGQKTFHPDVKMYKKKFAPEGTPEELKEWYQYRNLAFSSDYKIDESLFERSLLDEVRKI